jgi:hypothetical protein
MNKLYEYITSHKFLEVPMSKVAISRKVQTFREKCVNSWRIIIITKETITEVPHTFYKRKTLSLGHYRRFH